MKVVELLRLEDSTGYGTFGVLKIDKAAFCVTLEPPDLLNQSNRSCIPAQQYICARHSSPTYGATFLVQDVPGRSQILFHPGNVIDDTEGCILVAQHFGKLRGNRAVLNSGKTFGRFMDAMVGRVNFHLTIKEVY